MLYFFLLLLNALLNANESEHKINNFIIYLAKIIFKISWVTFL